MNPNTITMLKVQFRQCREAGLFLTAEALAVLITQLESLPLEEGDHAAKTEQE